MKRRGFSVSDLGLMVILVALVLGWLRHATRSPQSLFGFGHAPAFDTGVVPMAGIVSFGIYRIARRRGRSGRWLLGFVVGGLASIAGFVVLGWTNPDAVRFWLRPIYWVQPWVNRVFPINGYLYYADTACFLPVQLAIALAGALIARYMIPAREIDLRQKL